MADSATRRVLTAEEFIEQGTPASHIMSIAAANAALRSEIEAIARQVSAKTGQSLQIPGAVTEASRRRRAANDNARRKVAA